MKTPIESTEITEKMNLLKELNIGNEQSRRKLRNQLKKENLSEIGLENRIHSIILRGYI